MLGVASLGHLHLGFSFPVFGIIIFGTPDGNYQFESGATYEGAPTHAGGLDSAGNYVYKRLLPDNNSPKIVQLGGGVRGNTA